MTREHAVERETVDPAGRVQRAASCVERMRERGTLHRPSCTFRHARPTPKRGLELGRIHTNTEQGARICRSRL